MSATIAAPIILYTMNYIRHTTIQVTQSDTLTYPVLLIHVITQPQSLTFFKDNYNSDSILHSFIETEL